MKSEHQQTLYNRSTLELHTAQANELINYLRTTQSGDEKNTISGLYQFCAKLKEIWQHVKEDNPYAELTLIDIERRIAASFSGLRSIESTLDTMIQNEQTGSLHGLDLSLHSAKSPRRLDLDSPLFFLPHAKLAIRIISYYDTLLCKLKTCKDFCLVNRSRSKTLLRRATRLARGVLDSANGYKHIKITRQDIVKSTPNALAIVSTHGVISTDILNYTRQSEYGPEPIKRSEPPN